MKWTKARIIYTVLSLLFVAVIPLALVVWQYSNIGEDANGFKFGITGVMLVLLVFLVLKKTLLNKWLEKQRAGAAQHLADLKIETDAAKIANLEKALRNAQTIECVFNAIIPIILFVASIIACKAMEAGIVKLGNVMACITVSYLIGIIFDVLASREVVSKNRGA